MMCLREGYIKFYFKGNTNMNINPISFKGYNSPLKSYYKKGLLPEVKYGIYGERLTKKTVSLEHLKPKALGGKNTLANYALADRIKNENRGNKPLNQFVDKFKAMRYLSQFLNIKLPYFDGNEYIKTMIETFKKINIF